MMQRHQRRQQQRIRWLLQGVVLMIITIIVGVVINSVTAFVIHPVSDRTSASFMISTITHRININSNIPNTVLYYEPKWKKKLTLAEELGINTTTVSNLREIGIIGTIPVQFIQGNVTKTTMAIPNQPLREVAIQAGQFIKYGCGKGECGTCEALVNGQWVRPCICTVPSILEPHQEYYSVQVKEVKNKARSSGKFYSVRSFLYGFYNNVLGMIGMVTYKRNAKQNYLDRMEYENLIKQKTLEKKRLKALQQQQQQQQ